MATEQAWGAYTDQAHLKATDLLLVSDAAGTSGFNVPGSHILARRSDGGAFDATGVASAPSLTAGAAGIQRWTNGLTELSLTIANGSPFLAAIQHRHASLNGNYYPLTLNPLGGNVGIGTDAPANPFDMWAGGSRRFNIASDGTVAVAAGASQIWYRSDNLAYNQIRYGGGDTFVYNQNNGGSHVWQITGAGAMVLAPTYLCPASDNTLNLGVIANRWKQLYAVTGTIYTSDERDKVWRSPPDEAELRAARRIIAELGFYQWIDAVDEKGPNGARFHFGARAQQVWAIMADEGLVDPIGEDERPGTTPYAFLCFDEWDEQREDEYETVTRTRTVHEPSSIIGVPHEVEETYEERVPTGRQVVTLEAGDRFGLRVDQLALFLIAAQEARLAALEAAA